MATADRTMPEVLRSWWPVLLGQGLEWYEFAVYAYLSKTMAKNFFDGSKLATWAGFSITFVARPVGGCLLACVADRLGRRPAMLISMLGMLVATVGQGLLPTFASGRAAGTVGMVTLVALRLVQGVCAGGEVCAICPYVVEAAPRSSMCFYASLAPTVALLAFSLASGVAALCELALSDEAMLRWGWRLPFLLALPGGLVAMWGRRWMAETDEFQRCQSERAAAKEASPAAVSSIPTASSTVDARLEHHVTVSEVCRNRGLVVALGAVSMAAMSTASYGGLIWNVGHAKEMGMDTSTADLVGTMGHITQAVFVPLMAHLADSLGIATVMLAGAFLVMVAGIPLNAILAANPGDAATAVLCISVGYGIASATALAASYPFFAGFFPTQTRALGFSLTFNVGMAYFGGFSPLILEALSEQALPHGPGAYIAFAGLTSVVSLLALVYLRARGAVRITYVRSEPFFLAPGRCMPSPRGRDASCAAKAADGAGSPSDEGRAGDSEALKRGADVVAAV